MRKLNSKFALLVCVLLAGCAVPPLVSSPLPEVAPKSLSSEVMAGDVLSVNYYRNQEILEDSAYTIEAGDVLNISVLEHLELSTSDVRVLPDGYISAIAVQRILARGQRVDELASELETRYKDELHLLDPKVNVTLIAGDERADVLADSGGLSIPVGKSGYVMLPFIAPVQVGRPFTEVQNDIVAEYGKLLGDKISVTVNLQNQATPVLYIMGEVQRPGPVPYARAMDPLTAIASAGGFTGTAEPSDVRVFRREEDGNYLQWSFDLGKALASGEHEQRRLLMKESDVVFVRKSGIAMANDFVQLYIRNMTPTNVGFGFSYRLNPDNNDNNN